MQLKYRSSYSLNTNDTHLKQGPYFILYNNNYWLWQYVNDCFTSLLKWRDVQMLLSSKVIDNMFLQFLITPMNL